MFPGPRAGLRASPARHPWRMRVQKTRFAPTLIVVLAGCVLAGVGSATAQQPCAAGQPQLIVYHAGSVSAAFKAVEKRFTEQTGACVIDVAGGSVSAARQITTGAQPCDIFASADYEVIDQMLKPAHFADYDILFARGAMVMAYTTASRNAATIAAPGAFNPPDGVPEAAPDWATQLTQPGVVISGSHPFLDPSGYRADLIFQLAQDGSPRRDLYDTLLGHYAVGKPGDALGKAFDYQFTYEHSARAAAGADPSGTYRYVRLPDHIGMDSSSLDARYARRGITIPGLALAANTPTVRIPASRVTWGLTVMKNAPNRDNALRFLQLLFSPSGVAMQTSAGPEPISPPLVSKSDYAKLPVALQSLVRVQSATH